MHQECIVALSTPPGVGAIALIRLSGKTAITLINPIFKGKNLEQEAGHTVHFGQIIDPENGKIIDEVLLTLFRAPRSFTKEDVVEISCHASDYIIQEIFRLVLKQGARLAKAGEFTQRAYLNGQLDLAQAEAIADLIASDSAAAHQIAMQQMRGGISHKIKDLRTDFIRLAALLELELDFSEEDVEFADRSDLQKQLRALQSNVREMSASFQQGNAIKNGVPVAIIGKPNAGKSTLLNALLKEERAIVSAIAGTTRDTIEDERIIEGIRFRFIDTAGLRETADEIEQIGIARTKEKIRKASLLLYLFDLSQTSRAELDAHLSEIQQFEIPYLLVANKLDQSSQAHKAEFEDLAHLIFISALNNTNLPELEAKLLQEVNLQPLGANQVIISNMRHYQALNKTLDALNQVQSSLEAAYPTEMIASDIREAVYHLGEITGEITNNDLLDFIFTKFCIGK